MRNWIAYAIIISIIFLFSSCNTKENSNTQQNDKQISTQNETLPPTSEQDKLTEAAQKAIMERADTIRETEESLATALREAEKNLRPEDWEKLKNAQPQWEKQQRGLDAAKLMQSGMPADKAYEEAIMMRIRHINALISIQFLRDNIIEWQGNYLGENATVEVYWYDKTESTHYVMVYDKNHRELFLGYGILENNVVIATDQNNEKRKLRAEFKDDSVTIHLETWDDDDSRRQIESRCGTYQRERGMGKPADPETQPQA